MGAKTRNRKLPIIPNGKGDEQSSDGSTKSRDSTKTRDSSQCSSSVTEPRLLVGIILGIAISGVVFIIFPHVSTIAATYLQTADLPPVASISDKTGTHPQTSIDDEPRSGNNSNLLEEEHVKIVDSSKIDSNSSSGKHNVSHSRGTHNSKMDSKNSSGKHNVSYNKGTHNSKMDSKIGSVKDNVSHSKGTHKSMAVPDNKVSDLPDEIKNFNTTLLKKLSPKKIFAGGRRIPPNELLPHKPSNSSVR
jgi:hypothetical protein